MIVGILGEGRWGQALARLVIAAGHEPLIAYRDKRPPHVLKSTDDATQVSAVADLLIVATSAERVRDAILMAKPTARHRVVVASRGIDPETGDWLVETVQQSCDVLRVGMLAGPAPAQEILNGGLCAGVIASPFDDVCERTTQALHSSRYRCYASRDLTGVCLNGAAMPVLATMLGVALNLQGAGAGLHAMLLARGLAETVRLGVALGADPTTALGLAGAPDLVAVLARPGQPYFDAGRALAEGRPPDTHAPEQLARALRSRAQRLNVSTPLLDALVHILDGKPAIDAVQALMLRKASHGG